MAKVTIEHDDGVTEVYTGEIGQISVSRNSYSFDLSRAEALTSDHALNLSMVVNSKTTTVSNEDKDSA